MGESVGGKSLPLLKERNQNFQQWLLVSRYLQCILLFSDMYKICKIQRVAEMHLL